MVNIDEDLHALDIEDVYYLSDQVAILGLVIIRASCRKIHFNIQFRGKPSSATLIITGNLYGIIAIVSGKWILMVVHSLIYTAFTVFAVYILIHLAALSFFNKNGEYTGLHNSQIAHKLEKEYRRLWFILFHYHPQLVKDGMKITCVRSFCGIV